MPIYDFDGSTSREIGKLYDWNGSTNSQIKEVYDFDGTTSRLIYKDAPDYLFNWGDNAEITGGWSVKKWVLSGSANGIIGADYLDLYIGNTGNSNRRIYIHTNKAVNVTDLKSISMTYGGTSTVTCPDHNAAWWGIEHFGLALSTFIPSDPQNQLPDTFTYKNYSKWWNRAPNVGGPGSFTWGPITNTIDTSGISGSFYVVLVLNAYDATSPYGFTVRTVTCTS